MKKLLTFLMSTGLIAPTVSGVVACMAQTTYDPKTLGLGIDKSNAFDDSVKGLESGFTNYYIVGDSLSDVDGISSYLGNFASGLFTNVINGIDLSSISPLLGSLKFNANVNIALDGDGYGYTDENTGEGHSVFSNGPTAGYRLGEKLGFEDLRSSNYYGTSFNSEQGYGNNYSVGGATASSVEGIMGTLLNNVTIDRQTITLLEQHIISDNDLTFFEIGGNDLFAMIDAYTDQTTVDKIFNEGINNIKKGLYNLLNNGMGKILFATPPKMNQVQRYVSLFKKESPTEAEAAQIKFINEIGDKYESAILAVIDEVNKDYPSKVKLYDLYEEFGTIIKHFKDKDYNVEDAYADGSGSMMENLKVYLPGWSTLKSHELMDLLSIVMNQKQDVYTQGDYKTDKVNDLVGLSDLMSIISAITGSSSSLLQAQAQSLSKLSMVSSNAETSATPLTLQLVMLSKRKSEAADIDKFFFTDFVHPTRTVHEYVADLLKEFVTA